MVSRSPEDQANGMTTTTTRADGLSRTEIATFHRSGFLGPYDAMSPAEMATIRARIETEVLPSTGANPRNPLQSRHLDQRLVYDLITMPPVLDRMRSLLGADIVVWASYFFNKEPGGAEIPWHQDANYWPIEPPINMSLWLAIDAVTAENSCVQLIPGSHRSVLPHVPSRAGMAFGEEADPTLVDITAAVDMELAAGQFFIFNERLLHHSHANSSTKRRLGLSARYTVPFVELLDQNAPPLFPGHSCVVVSGTDEFGLNRMTDPPRKDR
jgi:non-haem Fe2+, alpha-ketoglutarate-dependent halogenase